MNLAPESGPTAEILAGTFAYGQAGRRKSIGSKMQRLVRALVDHDVEVNPTLVIMESLYWGNDSSFSHRLEPSYAAPKVRAAWGPDWEHSNPFMRQFKMTEPEWVQLKRGFESSKEMVRTFHERGVLITAGSDVGMPWITPGVSFHRELELLRSTGISAIDTMVIGTRNGAKALGIEGEVGTVEEGKRADLIALTANPLEDIRATRAIELVIAKGRMYKPGDLLPSRNTLARQPTEDRSCSANGKLTNSPS